MTVPLPTMAQVRQASATTAVGKHASGALYVHRTALPKLPAEFQDVYVVARGIMENHGVSSSDADIIKFHLTKSAVSFVYLQDDFDFVAHPAEALVIFVDLKDPTISPVSRSFMKSRNPPILHRKEQLVLLDYPRRTSLKRSPSKRSRPACWIGLRDTGASGSGYSGTAASAWKATTW